MSLLAEQSVVCSRAASKFITLNTQWLKLLILKKAALKEAFCEYIVAEFIQSVFFHSSLKIHYLPRLKMMTSFSPQSAAPLKTPHPLALVISQLLELMSDSAWMLICFPHYWGDFVLFYLFVFLGKKPLHPVLSRTPSSASIKTASISPSPTSSTCESKGAPCHCSFFHRNIYFSLYNTLIAFSIFYNNSDEEIEIFAH